MRGPWLTQLTWWSLGPSMGKGAKVRVASGLWDGTYLKGTTEGRGWPFYWLDLPVRLVMTSKVMGSGAPTWPMSPQKAISESYRLRERLDKNTLC